MRAWAGNAADMALGATAAAMPAWATEAQDWAIWYCAVAGALLVTARIVLLIRAALIGARLEEIGDE